MDAAAARAGLLPGLPLAGARALAPGLRVAPQDVSGDAAALRKLVAWCAGRYSPWAAPCTTVEGSAQGPGGAAGLLLDITGCAHLFHCPSKGGAAGVDAAGVDAISGEEVSGEEAALLGDLLRRFQGLGYSLRAGLGDTPGAAWALARFATGPAKPIAVAPPGGGLAALAPLPPLALRLTAGQGELMARFGLTSIAQLLALPRAVLAPRFGASLARRLAQALGEEREAISPLQPPPCHAVRRVFAEPIAAPESIAGALDALLPELCRQLEAAQRGARQLAFTCTRVDGSLCRLVRGTSRPSRDARQLGRLFTEALARIDPGFGIDALVLAALVTEPLGPEQLALEVPAPLPTAGAALLPEERQGPAVGDRALAALVDRLVARLGAGSVLRPWPRESHIPERAVALGPPFAKAPEAAWHRGLGRWRLARPLRLLPRPEPIEATALLPDHAPLQFRWRRLLHRVIAAEGPERLSPEWWRSDKDLDDQPARDYFRVEVSDGHRYWIYRRRNRWYLQGLFS